MIQRTFSDFFLRVKEWLPVFWLLGGSLVGEYGFGPSFCTCSSNALFLLWFPAFSYVCVSLFTLCSIGPREYPFLMIALFCLFKSICWVRILFTGLRIGSGEEGMYLSSECLLSRLQAAFLILSPLCLATPLPQVPIFIIPEAEGILCKLVHFFAFSTARI